MTLGVADVEPATETVAAALAAGKPALMWSRRVSDLETPVSALLKLGAEKAGSFLLESVEGGDWRGRYSIIGEDPDLVWRVRNGRAETSAGSFDDAAFTPLEAPPLQALRDLVAGAALPIPPNLPPMAAGLFGYLGYDMVRYVEKLPNCPPDQLGLPEAVLMRPRLVAIFDNVRQEITLVTPVRPDGRDAATLIAEAEARLADARARLDGPTPPARHVDAAKPAPITPRSNTPPERYREMVETAKSYARAGDIFQVVPSQRFTQPFPLPALALYRALRRINPSPFLFYLHFGAFEIVGASPEILVRLRDGVVTVRPIAGTRPRGATPALDTALEAELLADPKERSEHLMLLDLGRNDVGRVAQTGRESNQGGVRVTAQFTIERYSHVMHIVSNVEGRLRPDLDAIDALMAGFPAGTVSGAPKVRAMQIIDELEVSKRGVYAGGVGYFSAGGDMDTCIALRTAVIKDGEMHVQAGGGVVLDSDPQAEFEETVHKARALFRAAEEAWRFA
ncbi:MAG: anthranilate synthase component I [Alphaproteobacteria bacterium]|nr:anthranilate synthase component I [Alphaproteobacteria bacterium]